MSTNATFVVPVSFLPGATKSINPCILMKNRFNAKYVVLLFDIVKVWGCTRSCISPITCHLRENTIASSATSVSPGSRYYWYTWRRTETQAPRTNIFAQFVAKLSLVRRTWPYICASIQERNRMSATSVVKGLSRRTIWAFIDAHILEKNRISAPTARNGLLNEPLWWCTSGDTPEIGHILAPVVINLLPRKRCWIHI